MTCQRRVVSLNIQFDLFFQTKLLEEAVNGRGVVIILMLGRFLRLRLDQQRALEARFVFVLNHHLHEAANLLTLLTQVGIQQGFVPFTTAPQHVVFTTQFVRGVHRRYHLGGRPTEHFWIRVRRRPGTITGVGEAICRTPQQFHAALLLFLCQHIHHFGEVIFVLFQRRAFRRNIDIVEAVERNVQLVVCPIRSHQDCNDGMLTD